MDNQNFHQFKEEKKGLIAVLIIALIVFLAVLIISNIVGIQNKVKEGKYIGQDIEFKNTINVTETGEIYAKPDLAVINLSVKTEAKTVEQAMNENTEKMNKVIAFVKEKGIEDKDLKTTSFNIYPRYEYRKQTLEIYPILPSKRVLIGYEIKQELQVKIREMDKIGEIIEGSTNAGANQIGDLQFTIDNKDELKKQARAQAIEKAKDKAKELASLIGVKLIRVSGFSENTYMPYYNQDMMFKTLEIEGGLGGAEVPDIETGENKITVTVTLVYEIN